MPHAWPWRGLVVVVGAGGRGAPEPGQRWIAEETPDQLELPFALWTSRTVRELIERQLR